MSIGLKSMPLIIVPAAPAIFANACFDTAVVTAFSMFEHSAYCGPTGKPIHCSFQEALYIRLSWQPLLATAAL